MNGFTVIIPSARAENLVPCVHAVQKHDPTARIIVVDDGARETAESQTQNVQWIEGIKPFVFARNVNLGIAASAGQPVILLNDDAVLMTPRGFSALVEEGLREKIGILSAAVIGTVGNPRQHPKRSSGGGIRIEVSSLAFICSMIPPETVRKIGLLDERFVGYGGDDRDYCQRAKLARLKLGIFDGCIVDHNTLLRPTFRSDRTSFSKLEQIGRRIYSEKWGDK